MDKGQKRIKIFQNPVLELTTLSPPATPLLLWSPVIVWCFYRAVMVHHLDPWQFFMLGGPALVLWTLFEYLLHRFVFHFEGFGERLYFIIHGNHHDQPSDEMRVVMPPIPGVILAAISYLLLRAIFGPVWVEPAFAWFLIGYLIYDYSHYRIHQVTPKTRYGRMLKQNHMHHHFVNHNAFWGVSSPLWDYIFGTADVSKRVRHGS